MDRETYYLAQKLNCRQSHLRENGWHFTFHVAVGLASSTGLDCVKRSFQEYFEVQCYKTIDIQPISAIVQSTAFEMNWKLYNSMVVDCDDHIISDRPDYDATTVWLEHKMPNEHGSIPFALNPVLLTPIVPLTTLTH
jgi:hypothetical protein